MLMNKSVLITNFQEMIDIYFGHQFLETIPHLFRDLRFVVALWRCLHNLINNDITNVCCNWL